MRTLFIALVTLGTINTVSAMEMLSYKSTTSNTVTLADSAVESAWSANTPACLKDGSKILGVNKAFKEMALGYRDCSQGDGAVKKHKALGFSVTVIKLAELSDAKIREVLKK